MLKDIMVHLDGSHEDEIRLDYGQAIASANRAHVIGVLTNLLPDLSAVMPYDGGGAAAAQAISMWEEQARKDGDVTANRLAERLARLQVPSELRRFDETSGSMLIKVAELARYADLFIATRPYGTGDRPVQLDLAESVLFGSGRGLLIVPPGHRLTGPIQTVLVAWNGSREAARALSECLGLVSSTARALILTIDPRTDSLAGSEVSAHLARHGVTAEIVPAESRGRRVADVILEEATRASADLIVMGGYGHSRFREQVLGGATLDMLTVSDRPVLLAH